MSEPLSAAAAADCGGVAVPRHHHHLVYRSLGGKNDSGNLIVTCRACHSDIHARRVRVTGTATALTIHSREVAL